MELHEVVGGEFSKLNVDDGAGDGVVALKTFVRR